MPLRIQKRSWKNKDGTETVTWRLVVREWVGNDSSDKYPDKSEYLSYGISPADTLEVAKEKCQIINRSADFKRRANLKSKTEARIKKEKQKESVYLPKKLYEEFVEYLKGRRAWDDIPPKVNSHLLLMRKLILDLNLPPEKWPIQQGKIFAWFEKKHLSVSYLEKVRPLLNEYGYYYCQHFGKPFVSITTPPPFLTERINDSNALHRQGRTNESLPLKPEHFEKLTLPEPQLLWLRYSLYFGLRPDEVDHLTLPHERTLPKQPGRRWAAEIDPKGIPILAVYQPKLVKIPYDRRWKRIPCILPEQLVLLKKIREGAPIKRPYGKYIRAHIGEGYTLWAGRKGFKPLMRELGQSEFNIHRWEGKREFKNLDSSMRESESVHVMASRALGHQSLSRTNANYEDPFSVDYDPITPEDKKAK